MIRLCFTNLLIIFISLGLAQVNQALEIIERVDRNNVVSTLSYDGKFLINNDGTIRARNSPVTQRAKTFLISNSLRRPGTKARDF